MKVVVVAAAAIMAAVARRRQRVTVKQQQRVTVEQRPQKAPRRNAQGQHNPNFFAQRDKSGNLAINLRFIDTFLRWDCGRLLLSMDLFPNTQEITESMACLETIRERVPEVQMSSRDVVAVVIGDGRTPRTAALLSLRTKWHVLSIDPALHGLEPAVQTWRSGDTRCVELCASNVHDAAAPATPSGSTEVAYAELPKELRHPKLEEQEQTDRARMKRAKMRDFLATLDRLCIVPLKVQDSTVWLTSASSTEPEGQPHEESTAAIDPSSFVLSPSGHVVIVLPHAHVTPDDALRCLRFDERALDAHAMSGQRPLISVVQLPCCAYVFHDRAINASPDFDFMDARIATSARCVRVWRDVASRFDFRASLVGRGVPKQVMHLAETKARRRATQTSSVA